MKSAKVHPLFHYFYPTTATTRTNNNDNDDDNHNNKKHKNKKMQKLCFLAFALPSSRASKNRMKTLHLPPKMISKSFQTPRVSLLPDFE